MGNCRELLGSEADWAVEDDDDVELVVGLLGVEVVGERWLSAGTRTAAALLAEVVAVHEVAARTLGHAVVVVPEGSLATGAVSSQHCALSTDAAALLASNKIVEQEGAAGTGADTLTRKEVGQSGTANLGARAVLGHIDKATDAGGAVEVAAVAAVGAGLAGGGGCIFEEAGGAGEFALAGEGEAEVGGRAGGEADEGEVVHVVVDGEGGAGGDALALEVVEADLAVGAVGAVDAGEAGRGAGRAGHEAQVHVVAVGAVGHAALAGDLSEQRVGTL